MVSPLNQRTHENPGFHYIGGSLAAPSIVSPFGDTLLGDSPFVAREDHSHGYPYTKVSKTGYFSSSDVTLSNSWATVTGCSVTKSLVEGDNVDLDFFALLEQTAAGSARAEIRFAINGSGHSTVFVHTGNASTSGLITTLSGTNVYEIPSDGSYSFELECKWVTASGWKILTGSALFVSVLDKVV